MDSQPGGFGGEGCVNIIEAGMLLVQSALELWRELSRQEHHVKWVVYAGGKKGLTLPLC